MAFHSQTWLRQLFGNLIGTTRQGRRLARKSDKPLSRRLVLEVLEDRVTPTAGHFFDVTTLPAPALTTNKGITAPVDGLAVTFYSSQLQAAETGLSDPTKLTFTINTAPTLGVLMKNGAVVGQGGTFTQDDVNNGRITYQSNKNTDPNALSDSYGFTVTDPNNGSSGPQTFAITFGHVTAANSVTDRLYGFANDFTHEFVLYQNGSVYEHTEFGTSYILTLITSTPTLAISAGLDTTGGSDVTLEFASDHSLWTHTGSNLNPSVGFTKLNVAPAIAGFTPKMFAAGMNGLVDVVFTNGELWQISLANVNNPTRLDKLSNVNFVAIGVHGTDSGAVEADYVAFNDNSPTVNGGVWEHITGVAQWVPVTSDDVYAISASRYLFDAADLSDAADLILSSRNAPGIVDHSLYAFRGTANSLTPICGDAVSSASINALGNDFFVLRSTGSLYEHRKADPISTVTPLVTAPPVPVSALYADNVDPRDIDFLFSNGTLWQVQRIDLLEIPNLNNPILYRIPLAS